LENIVSKKSLIFAIAGVVAAALLAGTAAYAWFTNNSKVSTNTVTGHSGAGNMMLLIGADESSLVDSNEVTVEINQVNETDTEKLIPVSTADLDNFWYCPGTEGNEEGKAEARRFKKVENEKYYYHGRMCIEMYGEQLNEDASYKLYLDVNEDMGGPIAGEDTGHLLSACRLGLQFGEEDPVIIKFSDEGAQADGNTVIKGVKYASGYVLDSGGSPVEDPAMDIDTYTVDSSGGDMVFPEKALTVLQANTPVEMNIFFYLEGCDENCISDIQTNGAKLHLAFYAAADTEG